jgi:type IV pilus assembly protein PilA
MTPSCLSKGGTRRKRLPANFFAREVPNARNVVPTKIYPSSIPRKSTCRSTQGFTLVEIMIVVVIIGMLAAMALPAFQRVRQSSQDKAVLNNARQLAAAADQYFLENGVSTVVQTDLVGSTNYVKALSLVANETYPDSFTEGVTLTVSGVAGQRTITYSP